MSLLNNNLELSEEIAEIYISFNKLTSKSLNQFVPIEIKDVKRVQELAKCAVQGMPIIDKYFTCEITHIIHQREKFFQQKWFTPNQSYVDTLEMSQVNYLHRLADDGLNLDFFFENRCRYTVKQMSVIENMMKRGLNYRIFADPRYDYDQMQLIVAEMIKGHEIDYLLDPLIPHTKMQYLVAARQG